MILATRGTRLTPLLATGLDTAVPPCETKDRVGSSVPRLVKLDAFFVKLLSVQPAGLTLLDTPALGLKVVEVVVLWVTVVVVIVVVAVVEGGPGEAIGSGGRGDKGGPVRRSGQAGGRDRGGQ